MPYTGPETGNGSVFSSFPTSPDKVTTRWLSDALGCTIEDFELSYFSEGTGVIGQVIRLRLVSDSGPGSIIAKFPSPVASNRAVAETFNMYGREVQFYDQIAKTISVHTPICYYAAFEESTQDFVILLEDLQAYQVGDQVTGCTLDEARMVTDALAELHSSTWQPALPENLISHNNPMQISGMTQGFEAGWPVVVEQFGDLIPPSARDVGMKIPGSIGRLLADMCVDPVCLVHADVRLDNLMFGNGEVIFVDWQSVCSSAPEQDLAYFLTQSVAPEIRAQEDLVARYHSAVCAEGIDYPLERCRERYRTSALYLLCYAVVIAGTLDMGNERGQRLARTLLGGSLNALEEMEAFELLG